MKEGELIYQKVCPHGNRIYGALSGGTRSSKHIGQVCDINFDFRDLQIQIKLPEIWINSEYFTKIKISWKIIYIYSSFSSSVQTSLAGSELYLSLIFWLTLEAIFV